MYWYFLFNPILVHSIRKTAGKDTQLISSLMDHKLQFEKHFRPYITSWFGQIIKNTEIQNHRLPGNSYQITPPVLFSLHGASLEVWIEGGLNISGWICGHFYQLSRGSTHLVPSWLEGFFEIAHMGEEFGLKPKYEITCYGCRRVHVCILTFSAIPRTKVQDQNSSSGPPRGTGLSLTHAVHVCVCYVSLLWGDPGLHLLSLGPLRLWKLKLSLTSNFHLIL